MTATPIRNRQGYRIERLCLGCDTLLLVRPCVDRQGRGRYCSAACCVASRPLAGAALARSRGETNMSTGQGPRAEPLKPRRTVYWAERTGGWWTGLRRSCGHCGGYLEAIPPDTVTVGPGAVACIACGREAAEVQAGRPRALSTRKATS